jgi:hypothetical protein
MEVIAGTKGCDSEELKDCGEAADKILNLGCDSLPFLKKPVFNW